MVRPTELNATLSRPVPRYDGPLSPARAFPDAGPSARKRSMSARGSFTVAFESVARPISCPARA